MPRIHLHVPSGEFIPLSCPSPLTLSELYYEIHDACAASGIYAGGENITELVVTHRGDTRLAMDASESIHLTPNDFFCVWYEKPLVSVAFHLFSVMRDALNPDRVYHEIQFVVYEGEQAVEVETWFVPMSEDQYYYHMTWYPASSCTFHPIQTAYGSYQGVQVGEGETVRSLLRRKIAMYCADVEHAVAFHAMVEEAWETYWKQVK